MKKKIGIFIIIFAIFCMIIYCWFIFMGNEKLEAELLNKEDASYIIVNVSNKQKFQIKTDKINYTIVDIEGNQLDTINELSEQVLTIYPKYQYEKNKIYKIELKEKDTFINKEIENAKCIYFSTSDTNLSKNQLKFETIDSNLNDNYILKDDTLTIDELEMTLKISRLNKEVTIKPQTYKLYIDDEEKSLDNLKTNKGEHTIKIEFSYNNQNLEYTKKVYFQEQSSEDLAKKIYISRLGQKEYDQSIKVDINGDKIPELICIHEYFDDDSYKSKIEIYSIADEQLYLVCSQSLESLEDMKLLNNQRIYLVGHIASDMQSIYILQLNDVNGKLKLKSTVHGELYQDHSVDSNSNEYSTYYIGNKEYSKKDFFEKYSIIKDLY